MKNIYQNPDKIGLGRQGESVAKYFFYKNNYALITQNFHTRLGEIDLILYDKNLRQWVFCEVKSRSSLKYGLPEEAVTELKKQKMLFAAASFIEKHPVAAQNYRFDILTVIFSQIKIKIRHLKGIYIAGQ